MAELRFSVESSDYYRVTRNFQYDEVKLTPVELPTYSILDEEAGGYIAFTTDEEQANFIADALNFTTDPKYFSDFMLLRPRA